MSIRSIETFDQYNPSQAQVTLPDGSTGNECVLDMLSRSGQQDMMWGTMPGNAVLVTGSFGIGQALQVDTALALGGRSWSYSLAGETTYLCHGFRFIMTSAAPMIIIYYNSQYSGGLWPQFSLQFVPSSGAILVFQSAPPVEYYPPNGYPAPPNPPGNWAQIGSTGSNVFTPGIYQFFECKFNITTGLLELRINNKLVLSIASGASLNVTGAISPYITPGAFIDTITFFSEGSLITIDDIYNADTTVNPGTFPCNDFIGDTKALVQFPMGPGASTQWVPGSNTGTTYANWQMVNGVFSIGDASYVEADAAGDSDLYNITPLATPATQAIAVQTVICARKVNVGAQQVQAQLTSSGTLASTGMHALSSNYGYIMDMVQVDPATDTTWLVSALDATVQIGELSVA